MKNVILVADDEKTIRDSLAEVLCDAGYEVAVAADGVEAIELLAERPIDVALLDLRMPRMTGMEVLLQARQVCPNTQVIMMTAFGTVDTAVEAVKNGASDFVTKPFVFDDILIRIRRSLEILTLSDDNRFLRGELESRYRFEGIVGNSEPLGEVLAVVEKLSHTRSSALITGETGTGKELIARAIHYNGVTKKGRFVAVNCGALPESLAESELFGHKRGAFTGAVRDKPGLFTLADGGTIFLDEVSSMSLGVQAKLLRAIEQKQIMPVGGTEFTSVNVRILCATNRDLGGEVEAERFREDLYYRLNVVEVHVPPLRERREDVPPLVHHFLGMLNKELNRSCPGVTERAMQAMVDYAWPGNVRELANVIERAIIFAEDRHIDIDLLAFAAKQPDVSSGTPSDLKLALRAFERQHILEALRQHDFDKAAAATALNVGVSSLYRKIDQLGIAKQIGCYKSENGTPLPKDPPGPREGLIRAH